MSHTTLISTGDLDDILDSQHSHAPDDSSALAVIDCRYALTTETWGAEQYRAGHIPNAVYASLSHDLSGETTGQNGRHPLPTIGAITATLSRLGIGPGTQVVVYDQDSGMLASRLWWMLRYLGHDAVALLDGGWAKWITEERAVRAGDESREPATFQPRVREAIRLGVADMERVSADHTRLLVDARGSERFEGRSEPIDRVPGHIPGAQNHPYTNNVTESGVMRAPEVLRAQFDSLLGDRHPDEVVMYCGSGVSACHNLLAMEHVGLSGATLYPGSWSEWSADPRRAVETGPAQPR